MRLLFLGVKLSAAVILLAAFAFTIYVVMDANNKLDKSLPYPKGSGGELSQDAKFAISRMGIVSMAIALPTVLNHVASVVPKGRLPVFMRALSAILSLFFVGAGIAAIVSPQAQDIVFGFSTTPVSLSSSDRAIQSMAGFMVGMHGLPKLIAHMNWYF